MTIPVEFDPLDAMIIEPKNIEDMNRLFKIIAESGIKANYTFTTIENLKSKNINLAR